MSRTREAWLALLTRPFPEDEAERFRAAAVELERKVAAAVPGPSFDAAAFHRARFVGSNALARGELGAREAWGRANTWMGERVAAGDALSWERIRRLNGMLRGTGEEAPFRTTRTNLGQFPCPAPSDLEALLAPMLEAVASRSAAVHPVAGAALAGQWLVSVHPFDDANGRTARLVSDWWLAAHGFPPAIHPDFLASLNGLIDHEHEVLGVADTATMLLAAVEAALARIKG